MAPNPTTLKQNLLKLMIKTLIFDFDGVIADTYKLNYEIFKLISAGLSEQDFKDHHNGNVFESKKVIFTPESDIFLAKKMRENFTKAHFFDLKEVLTTLSKDFPLFIISSNDDDNIEHFLQLDDYHELFKKILGANVHRSKVEKFKMVFKDYDLKPENCLFITDTIGDIIEAHKVDVKTIAVTWGYHEKELLLKHKPFSIVHNKKELMDVILKTITP